MLISPIAIFRDAQLHIHPTSCTPPQLLDSLMVVVGNTQVLIHAVRYILIRLIIVLVANLQKCINPDAYNSRLLTSLLAILKVHTHAAHEGTSTAVHLSYGNLRMRTSTATHRTSDSKTFTHVAHCNIFQRTTRTTIIQHTASVCFNIDIREQHTPSKRTPDDECRTAL